MALTPPTQPTQPSRPPQQATRLGCGRDVDDVWDAIDRPPSEHERSCPYCTQARAELAALSAATHDLTAADQQDETLKVLEQMLANVLAIVRTEVRRGRTLPLQRRVTLPPKSSASTGPASAGNAPDGADAHDPADASPVAARGGIPELTVSELVIATVVRAICDRNPDIEVRRVSITSNSTALALPGLQQTHTVPPSGAESGDRSEGVEPANVSMDLQATVSHTAAIPTLLSGLRAAIQAAVTTQIGVTVSRINVDVSDLIDA